MRNIFYFKFLSSLIWVSFLSCPVHAAFLRDWTGYNVEGAACAKGEPYQIYISPGRSDKVTFYFMGGGACWSEETCFGTIPLAILFPFPFVYEIDGMASPRPQESPVADNTIVYFPYCTGDVHMGDHIAQYGRSGTIHHTGKRNVQLAFAKLKNTQLVNFEKIDHAVVYGYSAGAIGAIAHLATVEKYLPKQATRKLISDAPGLHFTYEFWDKFTPQLYSDYRNSLAEVGGDLDGSRGNLASIVPQICKRFSHWEMGFLQGSRDIIMSQVFGAISPLEHERMIYGENGLYNQTLNPNDNCSAWVPKSSIHTFLLTWLTSAASTQKPKSAMDFTRDIIEGRGGRNYR